MNEKLVELKLSIAEECQSAINNSISNSVKIYQDKIDEINKNFGSQSLEDKNTYSVIYDEIKNYFKGNEDSLNVILGLLCMTIFSSLFSGFIFYIMLSNITFNLYQWEFNLSPFGLLIFPMLLFIIKGKNSLAEKVERLNAGIDEYKEHKTKLYQELSKLLDKNEIPTDFNLYISDNHYYTILKDIAASKELLILLSRSISMDDFEDILACNTENHETVSLDMIILGLKKAEKKEINKNIISNIYQC